MEPTTTSQPFTLNRGDGTVRTFKKLTASQRIEFRNAFRLFRKRGMYTNLLIAGVAPAEAVKVLNEFDNRRLPENDVTRWVDDAEGQQEAILLSLQRDKPEASDADVDALDLTDAERHSVAAGVLGIELVWIKDGEEKPDPTTAGTAPTGGATQPSSAAGAE
jgi:hypothetical protein